MPTRQSPSRPSDVDLTGGFRLDLKTGVLLLGIAASWWNQGSRIDAINTRLELEAKARVEVAAAEREAEKARGELAAQQQKVLADSLVKLEAQLKVTSMDVGDLKLLTAKGR